MSSCAARELRLLPGALAAARLHAAAPQPGSGDPALQASGEQQQESVQSAQARAMPPAPTQRTLRPRVRPACEPLAALQAASSEDSDVYTDVPSASPPARRTRGNATRPRNRQKVKQAAVTDELDSLRCTIVALRATKARQETEIELLQQRLLLATSALLPPELA